jgi:hypothetical protein
LEAGQRAAQVAEEDSKHYFDVDHNFALKSAEYNLKAAKEGLEYQEEELRQLEKMYKADDITEESEEIVLKRARTAVDRAKFSLEAALMTHEHTLKYVIPRNDEQVKDSTRRKLLEWEKSKVDLPLALQRQRLEVEKLRMQSAQSQAKLNRMTADREAMTIKSPADGIVYYGKWTNGKPADSTPLADSLRAHGTIQPHQVVMTVVQPRPVLIRGQIAESLLCSLHGGMRGTSIPTGYPDRTLSARIDRVGDIPLSPGNFEVRMTVDLKDKAKWLVPGMTCKVKFVSYQKKDALCVPPSTLITDDQDEQKKSVKVLNKEGKAESRPVTIGKKTDSQVEILDGLNEGDQVLLDPSKEQK